MPELNFIHAVVFILGAAGGAIGMFFYAQKHPQWVQDLYQKQRAASMQGTEEIDKLKAQLKEVEMSKLIEDKVREALAKLKG